MGIRRINDPAFSIEINDAKLSEILEEFNTNSDDAIDPEDFSPLLPEGVSKKTTTQVMREAVTNAFVRGGLLQPGQQRQATLSFFDLYERVRRFQNTIEGWKNHHTDTWGRILEFEPGYWKTNVRPLLSRDDRMRGDGLASLAYSLYSTLHGLAQDEKNILPPNGISGKKQTCGGTVVTGFKYNNDAIPESLKEHVSQVVQWYTESARWLFQYSYIQCEGDSDECNGFEFAGTLFGIEVLWTIEAGRSNQDYTKTLPPCGDRWWNGKNEEIYFPRSSRQF